MKFSQMSIAHEIIEQLSNLNYRKPTDIQYKAIPSIQKGEDVLGIAQTGTGKTAAFVIPILDKILRKRARGKYMGISCLVMVPTRELSEQIAEEFDKIGKLTDVKVLGLYGGVSQEAQITSLNAGIDVLVSTPGRMFDLIHQGYIRLNEVDTLILDEADRMLALGFFKDINDIIRQIPKKRQTLFFSATINEEIKKLAYSIVKNPIRIQISPKDPISKKIDHGVVFVEMDDKRFFLERIINENSEDKIIVFVRTKVRAERVVKAMERVGINTISLHGDKEQVDRTKALHQFKANEVKVLISTDLSARGLDVNQVAMVINYDIPDDPENYVHRIGRTGRGDHKGMAISFCSEEEKPLLEEIQKFITKDIKVLELENEERIMTKMLGGHAQNDWKSVMKEIASLEETTPSKKKKKKR